MVTDKLYLSKTPHSACLSRRMRLRRFAVSRNPTLSRKYRLPLAICLMLGWLFIVFYLYVQSENTQETDETDRHLLTDFERHERWIVVTTINPPSPALKMLAGIPGWKMVVVGDVKSPKGLSLPNVVYLNTEKQKRLGYRIANILPENSYTRKNIGYLYAIQHGAVTIYETDDDNYPSDMLQGFIYNESFTGLSVSSGPLVYNPFVHFGHSSLWPRGFPLEYIAKEQLRKHCVSKLPCPAVQQGMVNGEPDVDALYRLINKPNGKDLDFDSDAPPIILENNKFSPFNSQNTLYHYNSFWSLLLPITTTFRVCDIWRSYWAQGLMKLVDIHVGFVPPNAKQIRNPHSLIKDASEEVPLYIRSGELLHFLLNWNCEKEMLYDCMRQLTSSMAEKGFWGEKEKALLEAWLTDLTQIGYQPPVVTVSNEEENLKIKHCEANLFYTPVQDTRFPSGIENSKLHSPISVIDKRKNFIYEKCWGQTSLETGTKKSVFKFQRTLLIIVFQGDYSRLPLLEVWYRPHFHYILYCTIDQVHNEVAKSWGINVLNFSSGSSASTVRFSCLRLAGKLFPNLSSYLMISDHILLNLEQIRFHSLSDIWITDIQWNKSSVFQCDSNSQVHHVANRTIFPDSMCVSKIHNSVSRSQIALSNVVLHLPNKHLKTILHVVENRFSQEINLKSVGDDLVLAFLMCRRKITAFKCLNHYFLTTTSFTGAVTDSFDYLDFKMLKEPLQKITSFKKFICQRITLPL